MKPPHNKIWKLCESQTIDAIVNQAKVEILQWEDESKKKNDEKFTSLEHKGNIFTAPYKPHGVPLLHKGKEIILWNEEEEVAN